MTVTRATAQLRGTQSLVGQMGWVFRRPTLTFAEIAWRWLFGIPFLLVCWRQGSQILAAYPLSASGFNSVDVQNPWLAVVQLAGVWSYYQPHVFAVLRWLVPAAAAVWVLISAVGRNLVLQRIEPRLSFRPVAMIVLQAAWLALLALIFAGWYGCMQWAAASHINSSGEPDLVGFAFWAIFLSLGFFTFWALVSWVISIAPLLVLLERCSAFSALGRSLRLGKEFNSKLAETNLVMGIVKLALIVLAMVFSAAPLPFADELGSGSLHAACAASTVFYLVANDYFHVVRLKGFIEFWRIYRGS